MSGRAHPCALKGRRALRPHGESQKCSPTPTLARDLSNLSFLVCALVSFDILLVIALESRSEWWAIAYGQRAFTLFSMALGIGALFRVCTRFQNRPMPKHTLIGDVSVVSRGHRGLGLSYSYLPQ